MLNVLSRQNYNKTNEVNMATVGMFDNVLFDNSKLIMYNWQKVSFLRKKNIFW
jgi:hypothetical protein